jgi:predicted DNA-binding transcriptional regulator
MPTKSQLSPLKLSADEIKFLEKTAKARSLPKREVDRANILLYYHSKMRITEISLKVAVSRLTVYKCLGKALSMGVKICSRFIWFFMMLNTDSMTDLFLRRILSCSKKR